MRALAPVACEVLPAAARLGSSGGLRAAGGSVRATGVAAGALAAGGTLIRPASLPSGQTKSSARPGGAATGSPLTNTRFAMTSLCSGCALEAPSNSSEFVGVTVSGTTGPATGRTFDFASSGRGPTGPTGSATGPRLLI
jgi:hypothetical protein